MKTMFAVGLLVLGLLHYKLWWADQSLFKVWHMQKQVAWQEKQNQQLRQRNQQLFAEIQDLKHGTDAIEENARHELGMVKEGEDFYQFVFSNDS